MENAYLPQAPCEKQRRPGRRTPWVGLAVAIVWMVRVPSTVFAQPPGRGWIVSWPPANGCARCMVNPNDGGGNPMESGIGKRSADRESEMPLQTIQAALRAASERDDAG